MSPTNVKLCDIFKDFEIPKELSDVLIYSTDANSKERTMSVTVNSDKLIPYEIIEEFKKSVVKKYALASFVLKVKYPSLSLDTIDTSIYYSNLIFYVNELIPGVRHIFKDSTADYENGTFTIHCKYGTEMLSLSNCGDMLKKIVMAQLGEKTEFVFCDEKDDAQIEKLMQDALNSLPPIELMPEIPHAEEKKDDDGVILGKAIKDTVLPLYEITPDIREDITTKGTVLKTDTREFTSKKTGKPGFIFTFIIADTKNAYTVKCFLKEKEYIRVSGEVKEGVCVRVKGKVEYDSYSKESIISAKHINIDSMPSRKDEAKEKRVELHLHTKMSQLDAMTDAKVLVKQAIKWGHKAIAITDHGNVQSFPEAMHAAEKSDIKVIYGMECYLVDDKEPIVYEKGLKSYHCIIMVKNLVGLRHLYELVSASCLNHFYRRPLIPRSLLMEKREGLILGSACEAGELYREILKDPYNPDHKKLEEIVNFYDYLEIQPLGNNGFLLRENLVTSEEDLKYINRLIIELGKKYGKLTVATCDVHFLNPEDEIYRRILQAGQGYDDADHQAPLYFRTTDEMLKEFEYLGDELAYEVVVTNTNKIAELTEKINPIPPDKAPPVIEGSDELLRELTNNKAKSIYGEDMPELVRDRIDTELNSIISNGYSVLYIIAQKLVKKSNDDGYLVGSRGSVGSSFVAYLSGITEVNSLAPHYVCPKCKLCDFETPKELGVGSGYDLPPKKCPRCGEDMNADGQDIPFQTFLGFSGDKEPDIDLNFSGEYQHIAHKFVGELFGEDHVFKAGTVGTIADKTAYGYVKKYYEERGIPLTNANAERLVRGCTGVKRTTGQHPGGIIVVPTERDVHEFSPVQHPADDVKSDIITLHFDYHSIDQNLLKLDILGHDDPTVIKMLGDLIGIDLREIPMCDPETMTLFSKTDALGVTPEDIESEVGTFAIPEFGTKFVRQMLLDTKPTTFSELVQISGLSHGTDVWLNNAQDLIRSGTATLSQAICTRDDIMTYLINAHSVPNAMAFKIMESVRKGKGLTEEMEGIMKEHKVPDWYIASCKKIKYMFPKAHAVAYVTMAYRIAYCKVHYPIEFYAAYFTVRADDFDYTLMGGGKEKLLENKRMLEAKEDEISDKEKRVITIMELCNEMYARGFTFLPVNIKTSDALKFIPVGNALLPPLNALPGLGNNAALAIDEARKEEMFFSIEDLQQRSKANKTVISVLRDAGVLDGLPESSQVTFF